MGSSCNTYINTTSNSDWSPLFINTTSQNQNVAVNYTVYTSSGDTNPSIASANITVLPSSTIVQSVPSISYVQAPAEDNNVIHSGESTRVFGANFSANSTVTVFIGNYSASGFVNSDGSQVSFIVPTIPAGTYSLHVADHVFTTNSVSVNVPSLNITQPSITVTSPNGGERFASDQSIPVKWNMNYANTGASIIVRLLKDGSGNVFDSQPIRGVSGLNTFTIPAGSVGAGSYRAEVVDNPGMGGNDAYDDGDGYFTVATPVPPCLNGAGALLPGQSYCSSSASSVINQSLGAITTIPNQVSCKFDATKYADYYPDLKRAFGYDQAKLKSHWLINGLSEGRTPCGADMPTCKFNSATYLSYNPDVVRAGLDGKYHYTTYGVNEGRDVCRSTTAAANDNVASVSIAFDDIMKLIQVLKK